MTKAGTISFRLLVVVAAACVTCAQAEETKIGGTGAGLATMQLLADCCKSW